MESPPQKTEGGPEHLGPPSSEQQGRAERSSRPGCSLPTPKEQPSPSLPNYSFLNIGSIPQISLAPPPPSVLRFSGAHEDSYGRNGSGGWQSRQRDSLFSAIFTHSLPSNLSQTSAASRSPASTLVNPVKNYLR